MNRNRLDIDYKIIDELEKIANEAIECIRICDWERKEELDKLYFEIYDNLDVIHQDYIEEMKRRNKYEWKNEKRFN